MSGTGIHQNLHQRQTQSLALAPQFLQSLKILQAATLDLRSVVQEELQTNPALEEILDNDNPSSLENAAELDTGDDTFADDDTASDFDDDDDHDASSLDDGDHDARGLDDDDDDRDTAPGLDDDDHDTPGLDDRYTAAASDDDDGPRPQPLDFSPGREYDILLKLDEDSRDHFAGAQPYTAADAEERQRLLDSITTENTLQEHLREQAVLASLPPRHTEALHYLIDSLDERGYLTQSPVEIALQTSLPAEAVNEALSLLQTFDPAGIGAQNIQECLLLQLAAKTRDARAAAAPPQSEIRNPKSQISNLKSQISNPKSEISNLKSEIRNPKSEISNLKSEIQNPQSAIRDLAALIIRDHFDLLARRGVHELSRKLKLPPDAIQAAITEIATLDPAPGRRFTSGANRVVIPDITITRDAGARDPDGWKIEINNDYIPRLRISNTCRELIAKGALNKEERGYVRERIRSGKFLINAIGQRQRTIERIAREILENQREFFETGVAKLKPLTMSRVAAGLGLHETTISRAIAGKYMETPRGVFELKYFFPSGYEAAAGETVSSTSVKEMIAALVAAEDRANPLNDQALAGRLAEKNIPIARRTIAKYREELGILPSSLRRDRA